MQAQPLQLSMTQLLDESAPGEDGTQLLQLANQQRLSTDAQRAAFCCLMGASDPAQAAERLLRLPLKVGQSECDKVGRKMQQQEWAEAVAWLEAFAQEVVLVLHFARSLGVFEVCCMNSQALYLLTG